MKSQLRSATFQKSLLDELWNEMSQVGQAATSDPTEGYPVTNLTLVVLLLIPCVVILLLLNCLFLGYKLLVLSQRKRQPRGDAEELLLQRISLPPLQEGRAAYMSLSEPVLPPPVTSSRASSRERAGLEHRIRLLRPDGATGSGSLRAPSTIRAASSAACFTPRLDLVSGSRTRSMSRRDWSKSAPLLPLSSDSEAETRVNLVPPNSPMVSDPNPRDPGIQDLVPAESLKSHKSIYLLINLFLCESCADKMTQYVFLIRSSGAQYFPLARHDSDILRLNHFICTI